MSSQSQAKREKPLLTFSFAGAFELRRKAVQVVGLLYLAPNSVEVYKLMLNLPTEQYSEKQSNTYGTSISLLLWTT
jgi:hypothetical protein